MRNKLLAKGYRWSRMFGVNPRAAIATVRNLGGFVRDLNAFRDRARSAETQIAFGDVYPCLGEANSESGVASGHYFHQDLLVARRVFEARPERHVDVGSRVDGFIAHVAAFRTVEVLDIRPLSNTIPNIVFRQANVMELPHDFVASTDSASCLHALEHFGLGRYGDPIDPDGHLKGLSGLHALVRPGGTLYLSVPIGPQRIEFNAHRVFAIDYLLDLVRGRFDVEAFHYVDDAGDLHERAILDSTSIANSFGCHYGCGIFELRRS